MADQLPALQPAVQLPQPVTFFGRMRLALDVIRGSAAQPLAEEPVRDASPTEPGAPAAQGTYTRAFGGFSIDPRWLQQLALNDDSILQREGQHDLKLYDAVLDDDVTASSFQQRRLAVVSRPWEVDPGDDSALAKAAADHLRLQISRLGWDDICDKMLFGRWYGYAVGECMYGVGEDGKIWLNDILVPDRKWFAFTNAGELRLRTAENSEGEILPPNKFWAYRSGASHHFAPYGVGLAHWCYWPVWFKKNVIKFWAVYLEKFGMPTALGTFPEGAQEDVIANTLAAAQAVGRDSAVVKPENVNLELMAEGRSSQDSYLQFVGEMNDAIMRVILSQTGTAKAEAQGLGGSQSNVHKDVRNEVIRADSDLLHESFNRTVATWLTAWNFGPNCPTPRVYRNLEETEDLGQAADRDVKLFGIGIRRTKESVQEVYGEGYELVDVVAEKQAQADAAARAAAAAGGGDGGDGGTGGGNVASLAEARAARMKAFAAQDRAPLYVYRQLQPESARALLAWARGQKIPNLEPANELHVTVLYSKAAVDWFEMGECWDGPNADGLLRVAPGGPRKVDKLGEGSIVLRFNSGGLRYRHEEMVERGASHDYEEYLPHVTIAEAADFDPSAVEPFVGELIFGPEIFEAIETDGLVPEPMDATEFSAAELDNIDRWAAELASEADPLLAQFAAALQGKVKGVRDARGLQVALLSALESFPVERLGELTALPMVAVRAGAEAGIEAQVRP